MLGQQPERQDIKGGNQLCFKSFFQLNFNVTKFSSNRNIFKTKDVLIIRGEAEKIGSGVGCKMVAWSAQHCIGGQSQPWESKLTIVVIVATPKLSQIPTIPQFGKNIPKQVQAFSLWLLIVVTLASFRTQNPRFPQNL